MIDLNNLKKIKRIHTDIKETLSWVSEQIGMKNRKLACKYFK